MPRKKAEDPRIKRVLKIFTDSDGLKDAVGDEDARFMSELAGDSSAWIVYARGRHLTAKRGKFRSFLTEFGVQGLDSFR